MIAFRNCAVLVVIASICSFFYGVFHIHVEVEPNACRMTYMFEEPQYARVRFDANQHFPNYGLYYYYEGTRQPLNLHKMHMTGAPVIFIPGNAGSYKQVRSLASVALRKARDNPGSGIHLDYYTIDFDEELSALYGGYMYHQRLFLKQCILTVVSLYKQSSPIVLIGHSMGGKLAQSVLTDLEIGQFINSIISISTPLDQPVLNLDVHLNQFYAETHELLSRTRSATQPSSMTNVCQSPHQTLPSEQRFESQELSSKLDNVLLISTGGGNRDLLVQSGLTTSQFNDLHAMTSAIPRVSLSCDHLSAVWCLQFMQVITRFLFSIAHRRDDLSTTFSSNKQRNVQSAFSHFVKYRSRQQNWVTFQSHSNWHEERRMIINKFFAQGLKSHYYELIGIQRPRYKKLAIEALNVKSDENWLFGCESHKDRETELNYCDKATPLTHLVQRLTSGDSAPRSVALLDLHNLRKTYKHWTHVMVRLPAGSQRTGYNLDIYDPKERILDIRMPRWYAYGRRVIVNETLQGALHYRLRISELVEPYQGLRIIIEPLQCLQSNYRITAKLCVPWAAGFERYQTLTSPDQKPGLYINVPTLMPKHYNTTLNPVTLDLYLDPVCRYRISYEYSYADALSRLVLEFYGWLPAHFVCVLLIVLRKQLDKFQPSGTLKSLRPYVGFLQYTSLYIVTGCRLLKKLILNLKVLPTPEPLDYSINISIIIQCTAIGLSIFAALGIWLSLVMYGNAFHSLALRLTRLSAFTSNIMLSIMTHLPITYGIVTVAIAMGTCSGLALLLAFIFYFLLLSNAYKDYLEDYLWQKAASLVHMATGTGTQPATNAENERELETSDDSDAVEIEATEDQQHQQQQRQQQQGQDQEPQLCVGLQNFPFHITLLLLLLVLLLLSAPTSLAWLRSRRHGIVLPDPCLHTTIVVLSSLSILLQLRTPQKLRGYWILSIVLYFCAGIVLLYCQEAIYRLNYVIAGAFAMLAVHQSLERLIVKMLQ